MKISIRQGVFETNSSSVHSCSICTEDNYKKFSKGEVWYKEEGDEYLPVDEAVEFNLNMMKEYEDVSENDFDKFAEVYRETKSFYDAFRAIGVEFHKWDIDVYELYLNCDSYWEYHEYEDWSHKFNDSNGTPMIAWGYCGHD